MWRRQIFLTLVMWFGARWDLLLDTLALLLVEGAFVPMGASFALTVLEVEQEVPILLHSNLVLVAGRHHGMMRAGE